MSTGREKQSHYLALGINKEGRKELLGLWISENEGTKFWLSLFTELQTIKQSSRKLGRMP